MPKITTGLSGANYCLSNGTAKSLCRSVSISANIEIVDAVKWYADNSLQETSLPYFNNGSISITCDNLTAETIHDLFGTTQPTSPDTWTIYSANDAPAKCAIGFVCRVQENSTVGYIPVAFPRIQFKPLTIAAETQGESVAFQNLTLEGTIYADDNGAWKFVDETTTYATEAAAITALQTKLAEIA